MRARTTAAAFGAIALLSANLVAPPAALAVAPPVIDPGALPPNDPPGPTEEMKQNKACVTPVVIADPDVGQPPPGNAMLDIRAAWQYSTGAGVSIALIDTVLYGRTGIHADALRARLLAGDMTTARAIGLDPGLFASGLSGSLTPNAEAYMRPMIEKAAFVWSVNDAWAMLAAFALLGVLVVPFAWRTSHASAVAIEAN